VEFSQLFGQYSHLRESLLEKMPAMTINKINGTNSNGDIMEDELPRISVEKTVNNIVKSNTDTLLDLLGNGDDIISPPIQTTLTTTIVPASNLLDLLGDIDISAPAMPIMNNNNNNNNIITSPVTMSILDDNENTKISESLFSMNGSGGAQTGNYNDLGLDFLSTPTTQITTSAKITTAFDKNDLLITFATTRKSDYVEVIMTTTNNSLDTLEQYLFQVNAMLFIYSNFQLP
jgi:AP-1 complex subunit gamma-1